MKNGKVNVLYFNNFATYNSGSPKSILGIASHIDKGKYNPIMAVSEKGPFFDASIRSSIKTVVMTSTDFSLDNFFRFNVSFFKNLFFLLRENINLLHVNYLGWRDSIVIAASTLRINTILHVRNIPSRSMSGAWNVKLADKIIAVSEGTRLPFKKNSSAWNKSLVIYNAIDDVLFSNGYQIKSELNIPEHHLVVGVVGQISHRKGIHNFVEMAAIVQKEFANITFLIVGEEPLNDPGYEEKMKIYARELRVEDKIKFIGFRKDVQNIMKSLDVLTVPSLSEPFARVILEAMISGIPVVGTQVDGIPEAVIHGQTGLLVPVGASDELAKAVSTLLDNKVLRINMGQEARRIAMEKYNMNVLTSNIEKVYSNLLQNGCKPFCRKR